MNKLNYLIEELIKENSDFYNVKIPEDIDKKKELFRALRNVRMPKPISDDYLKIQDDYLKEEIIKRGITNEENIPYDKEIISIWKGDITSLRCDVIVNACNGYLLGCFVPNHNCIDNAIHSFAGMQLREECNNIMKGKVLSNGEVILTNAYNLPCKKIIHTVGPQVDKKTTRKDIDELEKCYYNSLEISRKNNLKTIAFPCIATGLYGFPQTEACKIAIDVVTNYIKQYPKVFKHIIFNVFKEEDLKIYQNILIKKGRI